MYLGNLRGREGDIVGIALASILLREKVLIPSDRILVELHSRYPELGASLTPPSYDQTASFVLKFGDAIIAEMGAPVPWSDLEGPCATSLIWRDATTELRKHQSHIIVTVRSDVERVEAAVQLTKVTAAVLATCDSASGVFWFNAALIVPKVLFLEICETVLLNEAPVDIWVDFRVGRADGSSSTGFTQGLRALGLMEIEAQGAPETVGELRNRLQNLARYLVQNGPVIGDGHSVGYDAEERIRVVYGKSAFGGEGQVMQLQYETPKKKWPWQR